MPIARLDDRAIVRITGPDAADLLQNVLTLDVAEADRNGSGYGALLTPQGKILWDFILHKLADGYAVDLRGDQADAFAKRLMLYKLRAKVDIATALELGVFVAWNGKGKAPDRFAQREGGTPADPRLADLGSRFIAPADSVPTDGSAAEWHARRIALAIPEGGVDFVFGDVFPHDAAMDSLHGIAFDKGCYIGQEVVSRMRHRGTARRRIVALSADSEFPSLGADIVADNHPIGRLGSSAEGRAIGLVRLDRLRQARDAGRLVKAGDTAVSVKIPDWATYDWPATAGEA